MRLGSGFSGPTSKTLRLSLIEGASQVPPLGQGEEKTNHRRDRRDHRDKKGDLTSRNNLRVLCGESIQAVVRHLYKCTCFHAALLETAGRIRSDNRVEAQTLCDTASYAIANRLQHLAVRNEILPAGQWAVTWDDLRVLVRDLGEMCNSLNDPVDGPAVRLVDKGKTVSDEDVAGVEHV